ncbi:MAG TPA: hypothetical protein VLH85_01435 [Levilinea sp.]|nr:hypothetical protein [Levilinea sp.]
MKTTVVRFFLSFVSLLLALSLLPHSSFVLAQDETPTVPPTATVPAPSRPLIIMEAPSRPLIIMESYRTNNEIKPGNEFTLDVILRNDGGKANNVIIVFESADFLPLQTGGVRALVALETKEPVTITQPMMAPTELWGRAMGTVTLKVSYNDEAGVTYTETFILPLNIVRPNWAVVTATPTPTATPMVIERPQIVVAGYKTDIDPLQPGSVFNLELEIQNLGSADARAVTMVLGGGATVEFDGGTPQPGGIPGASGDLSVFAPLGSSNLFYVGDLGAGQSFKGLQQLIVNVSAAPGAYQLKLSFVYTDEKGNRAVDAQVITLLVYQLPQVEISFYRDPGMFMMGQPNMLPIQLMNLGRKLAVLGNMRVTCGEAEMSNHTALVGPVDVGLYFTVDPMAVPFQPGALNCDVTVTYTDDFNQVRQISTVLTVEVMDAPPPEVIDPGMEGVPPVDMGGPPANENFWQQIVRFFKGLFGLDSAPPQEGPVEGPIMEGPTEQPAVPEKPIEVRPKG